MGPSLPAISTKRSGRRSEHSTISSRSILARFKSRWARQRWPVMETFMKLFSWVDVLPAGRRTVVLLASAVLILLGLVGTSLWMVGETYSRTAELDRSQRLLESASLVLGDLRDAETGQRGYLLTLDAAYLDPYRNASTALSEELNELEASAAETDKGLVRTVRTLANAKIAELQATIDFAASGKTAEAVEVVRNGTGKTLMDDIREALLPLTDKARGNVRVNL
ncbi:MAG: hypothetical protein EON93_23140, partial [Burkholderiales bacterium]